MQDYTTQHDTKLITVIREHAHTRTHTHIIEYYLVLGTYFVKR